MLCGGGGGGSGRDVAVVPSDDGVCAKADGGFATTAAALTMTHQKKTFGDIDRFFFMSPRAFGSRL